ncbi:hypothetical protein HFP66_01745 [Bacillus sp. A17A.1]
MMYKNRKNTQCKYKKTIVATMTLGVSTLGSTVSAFAAEKKKEVQPQQATSASASNGPAFEKDKDGNFKVSESKKNSSIWRP